jgi:hypothetical protein
MKESITPNAFRSCASFRGIDEWKSALMTLPDGNFIELLRSVFGNFKTPFNKQLLLDDLFILLSRNEIRKTIAAYIDEQDHKIIATVAFLNEPAPGELKNFFAGEFSLAELDAMLTNLEERLIIYRFRKDGVHRFALNPVLEKLLEPYAANTQILFPSFPASDSENVEKINDAKTGLTVDSRILAAFIVFILDQDEPLKAEGELRKKVLDDGKKYFPNLDLDMAVRTVLCLGLLRNEGRGLLPNKEKITGYSDLPSCEIQAYWAAGVYLCLVEAEDNGTGDFPYDFSGNRLRRVASFIHQYMLLLDTAFLYPETTLRRFMEFPGNTQAGMKINVETFLTVMEKTGLLEKVKSSGKNDHYRKSHGADTPGENSGPVIVMDTAFSFILYPEISFSGALALGAFCSLKEAAAYGKGSDTVIFELTRESAVRGFDQGMSSKAMMEILNRLSLNRLDANLDWTLKDWERRYAGVSLYRGTILSLAEDRRYLAEAEPVVSLIRQTLVPGVYLLSSDDPNEAARALRKAGVDIVAQPPSHDKNAGFRVSSQHSFSRLGSAANESSRMNPGSGSPVTFPETEPADSIKQKFYRVLDGMGVGKMEREELAARIERRLVLSEAQLEGASLKYERLEARGLDYVGKSVIAKDAIAARSMVEVSWPEPGGETGRVVGIPRTLEKKGGENILVVETNGFPANTFRIPLAKISLLRRIKQSIFVE